MRQTIKKLTLYFTISYIYERWTCLEPGDLKKETVGSEGGGLAFGIAPALKGMTGAGKVVEAFAYACCSAVGVVNKWPARPFVTTAQVLVAAIPKTLRGLCMHGSRHMNGETISRKEYWSEKNTGGQDDE